MIYICIYIDIDIDINTCRHIYIYTYLYINVPLVNIAMDLETGLEPLFFSIVFVYVTLTGAVLVCFR